MPVAVLHPPRAEKEHAKPPSPPPAGPDRRKIKFLAGLLLVLMVSYKIGLGAGVAVAAGMLGCIGFRRAMLRWPQLTGSVVATATTVGMAVAITGIFGPWFALSGSPDLGVMIILVSVTLATTVWAAPLRGVHRGWTTLMALAPMWLAAGVSMMDPGRSAQAAVIGGCAGLAIIALQARHRVRGVVSGRRRRAGKLLMASIAVGLGLMTATAAAPASANAGFLSGAFNDFKDKFVCSIAAPNTSPELAGTGPESFLGNQNFVKLPSLDSTDNDVPETMDRPLDFGEDQSKYTLYELSGLRGIKFVNWSQTDDGGNDCSIMSWVSVTSGNMINKISMWFLQLVIVLKEYAQVKNPVESFFSEVTPLIDAGLTVLFSAMTTVLLALLLWGFFAMDKVGLASVMNRWGSGLVTLVVATFAYGGVTAAGVAASDDNNFSSITHSLDSLTGSVSAGVSELIMDRLPTDATSMCIQPEGTDSVAKAQRHSSCLLAEALAYKPWAKATFGSVGSKKIEPLRDPVTREELTGSSGSDDEDSEDLSTVNTGLPCYNNYQGCSDLRSYLIAQEGGPSILQPLEMCYKNAGLDEGSNPSIDEKRACDPYYGVAEDLYARTKSAGTTETNSDGPVTDDGTAQEAAPAQPESISDQGQRMLSAYRGDGTFSHAQNAFTSLIGVFAVGVALGILAIGVLWKHIELLILYVAGPWYLLLGAVKQDLKGVKEWGLKILGTFAGLLGYSVLSSIAVFFVAFIGAKDMGMLKQILMLAIMMFAIFKIYTQMNQKIDQATGTTAAPGVDKAVGRMQGAMGMGAIMGMARGGGGGGMIGRAASGVGNVAAGGAKLGARGARATGRTINNNTQGLQRAAGQTVGALGGATAYAGARIGGSAPAQKIKGGFQQANDFMGTTGTGKKIASDSRSVGSWLRGTDRPNEEGVSSFQAGRNIGSEGFANYGASHSDEVFRATYGRAPTRGERFRASQGASNDADYSRAQERKEQRRRQQEEALANGEREMTRGERRQAKQNTRDARLSPAREAGRARARQRQEGDSQPQAAPSTPKPRPEWKPNPPAAPSGPKYQTPPKRSKRSNPDPTPPPDDDY